MKKHLILICLVLVSLLHVACAGTTSTGNNSSYSNKWRIEVSEGAKSTGTMVFRFSFADQPSIDIEVGVAQGARENKVASVIRDAFRVQLPSDGFHIEKDDGEDVLVKRQGDTPRFAIVLMTSNVKSVRIRLDKE